MAIVAETLHFLTLVLVGAYKWIELQVLRLITPWLEGKGRAICKRIGIVYHFPGEEEMTTEEETALVSKTNYGQLIHVDVSSKDFFPRIANRGLLASGQMFMEGAWECRGGDGEVVELTRRILDGGLMDVYFNKWNRALEWLELCAFNLQTRSRAFQVGREHYDLGNDMYELMLDPRMQYTCGYWARANNLEEAQLHKMELIGKKLDLKKGMRVLDIGCGWGTLCKFLAETYGVECVGVTISEEGVAYGKKVNRGLPVEIRLQDYRDVNEKFDRIVSIGCLEHVGFRNYDGFFSLVRKCLKPEGLFLCHSIGNADSFPRSEHWLTTYIFPGGNLPYPSDVTKAVHGKFVIEDWHNFGVDYAYTLQAWRENFNKSWPIIQDKYGEDFRKMWIYYLTICEGIFRARKCQLWQLVLSPEGVKTGYQAPR